MDRSRQLQLNGLIRWRPIAVNSAKAGISAIDMRRHRYERGMGKITAFFAFIFRCRHKVTSRVFTRDKVKYIVCLECGFEFEYDLERMSVVGPLLEIPSIGR
jgi:hypothetical protein